MPDEHAGSFGDMAPIAQLIDCPPEPEPVIRPTLPSPTDPPAPISIARDATLAHTGADPPPEA